MLLRRVWIWSVILLCGGGVAAFVKPNLLTPLLAQNSSEQQCQEFKGQKLMLQKLNLTREQKQQLRAIQQQYKGEMKQQRQELLQAQQELTGLMAGTASQSQIREKYRQVEALRQEVGELQLESMLATREVMTPAQRRQFAQLMQQRKQNSRDRSFGGSENRSFGGVESDRSPD